MPSGDQVKVAIDAPEQVSLEKSTPSLSWMNRVQLHFKNNFFKEKENELVIKFYFYSFHSSTWVFMSSMTGLPSLIWLPGWEEMQKSY